MTARQETYISKVEAIYPKVKGNVVKDYHGRDVIKWTSDDPDALAWMIHCMYEVL